MRADELGRRKPSTLFYDRALSISKLRYHQNHRPKDQRTHAKNLQIVQVNAINLYLIPLIYNAASLGIDYCLRSASFVCRCMVDVICVIFIELGSIFRLCWPPKCDRYFSYCGYQKSVFFRTRFFIRPEPRHMSDNT